MRVCISQGQDLSDTWAGSNPPPFRHPARCHQQQNGNPTLPLWLCPHPDPQQHLQNWDLPVQTGKAAQRPDFLLEKQPVCVKVITELHISLLHISLWHLRFWSKLWKKSWSSKILLNRKVMFFSESSMHYPVLFSWSGSCITGDENGLVSLKSQSYSLDIGLIDTLERMAEKICIEKAR